HLGAFATVLNAKSRFKIESILVRSPNWIGDQVLSFPFFYHLRKLYPKAYITAVCVDWVQDIQFKDLVDEVFVLPRPYKNTWPGKFIEKFEILENASRQLKSIRNYDLAIILPGSFSAAWLVFRAGAKKRIGYGGDGRSFLLNDKRYHKKHEKIHRAQAFLNLLEGLVNFKAENTFPGEFSFFDPIKSWRNVVPLEPPVKNFWVLAPGSQATSRMWPAEYFLKLSMLIYEQTHIKGAIVGGENEVSIAAWLLKNGNNCFLDFTGCGSVTSYWKLFQYATFTVSNDSGLAHMSSLCGSRVYIVWGGGNPIHTRPLGPGLIYINSRSVDCWPCERNICSKKGTEELQCLKGIHPESVFNEIKKHGLLEKYK
ncbi:MAG: glycosyltransferase family 9 protein, partial [Deltaproteobacteria bacterium]|nr:glycosyltransferase family 9 protein [Deltaproteobacteria bacterium]